MAKKKASLTAIAKDPMAEMKKARNGKMSKENKISEGTELKSLNTRLPLELVRQIKIYCAENDLTVQDFMRAAVESKLSK